MTLTRRQRDRPRRRPPHPGGPGLERLRPGAPTLFPAPKVQPSGRGCLPAADALAARLPESRSRRPPRRPRPDSLSGRARLPSPTAALARFPQSPGRRSPPPRARPAPLARRRLLGPIVPRRLSRASRPPREPRRSQLTALGSGKSRKAEASPRGLNPLSALPRGTGWMPETLGSFSRGDSRLRTRGPVQGDWDGAGSDPSFPGPSSLESEHQLYGI